MALDRFIDWSGQQPSNKELSRALRNYVGKAGKVTWKIDRWFVTLPGKPSCALKGLPGAEFRAAVIEEQTDRWFEVIPSDANLNILTRGADEFTNAVAMGFVYICVGYWSGRFQE